MLPASHAVIQWKQWSAPTPWLMSSTNQRHYFLVIRARIGCPVCQTRESSWGAGSLVLGTLSGVQGKKKKKQLWFLSAVYDVMTKPSWNACKTHCLQFFVLSSLKQFGAVYKLHFARLQCCTVHHEHCGFVGELINNAVWKFWPVLQSLSIGRASSTQCEVWMKEAQTLHFGYVCSQAWLHALMFSPPRFSLNFNNCRTILALLVVLFYRDTIVSALTSTVFHHCITLRGAR